MRGLPTLRFKRAGGGGDRDGPGADSRSSLPYVTGRAGVDVKRDNLELKKNSTG